MGHFENPQYSREFEMNRDECIYIERERDEYRDDEAKKLREIWCFTRVFG